MIEEQIYYISVVQYDNISKKFYSKLQKLFDLNIQRKQLILIKNT